MVYMLMSLALAFGITFYAIPVIISVSNQKRLFDHPDDERKIHRTPIPSIGGLGIFAGFITALLLTATFSNEIHHFQYLIAALMIIFFVGVKDDLVNLTPLKKFLGQILAAIILVYKGGFVLQNMDGIMGIYEIPSIGSYFLSIVTIVVIINACNLIDGVDGLAGSLSFMSSTVFAIYFALSGQMFFACIATSLAGALAAFLIFNFNPAKIFMGDTGSLTIGLINAVLVIQFINSTTTTGASAFPVQAGPAIGFAILFVPLFDTLRIFSMRILHGQSPFTPDRNHIHHILLRFGLNHKQVTLSLLATNILIISLAYYGQVLGSNWLFAGLLALGFGTVTLLIKIYGRRRMMRLNGAGKANGLAKGKVRFISYITKEAANQN